MPKLSVNVDVANGTFWTESAVHITAQQIVGARDANQLSSQLGAGKGQPTGTFKLLSKLKRVQAIHYVLGKAYYFKKLSTLHPYGSLISSSTRDILERFSSGVLGVRTCTPTSCAAVDWPAMCGTLRCIRLVRNVDAYPGI